MSSSALFRPLLHVDCPVADFLDSSGVSVEVAGVGVTVNSTNAGKLGCGDLNGVLDDDPSDSGSAFRSGESALVDVEVALGPGSQGRPGDVFFLIRGKEKIRLRS